MAFSTIKTSIPRQEVYEIKLDRPPVNPLNNVLLTEICEACVEADSNETIGCIIIVGNEVAFCAGADIKQLTQLSDMTEAQITSSGQSMVIRNVFDRISKITKPIIACVQGLALGGGCELAMLCDFIIASDNAVFGQPEIKIGAMAGAGGTQRLTRIAGKGNSMFMNLLGNPITARRAYEIGLVAQLCETNAETYEAALKSATTLARYSRAAVAAIKKAVLVADNVPLDRGLDYEADMFKTLIKTDDFKEGTRAFVQKRRAHFNAKL